MSERPSSLGVLGQGRRSGCEVRAPAWFVICLLETVPSEDEHLSQKALEL